MLIWFSVVSVLIVAVVFKSPAVDYRTVIVGAVLPTFDVALGGPRLLHSVVGAALVMVVVVLATRHRRVLRRRLLGLPIGMMCHLVLDGTFTRVRAFWWPATGWSFASGGVPEVDHLSVSIVLEVVGVALGVWAWRRFGLDQPERRQRFWRDGRLELLA